MSQWHLGDGFRSASSPQSGELMQSWINQEESQAGKECWPQANAKASSFHYDASQLAQSWRQNQTVSEAPLAARLEITNKERSESFRRNDAAEAQPGKDSVPSTPLSRIYDILDVHSPSSRWLDSRGYLEAFKSPDCTLDLTFGTDGSKVGAVVTAPDGTKRTVVSCEGGSTFQRLTASNGQELVKFLSSGQIVELNPNRQA